jgi:hypothetical protein
MKAEYRSAEKDEAPVMPEWERKALAKDIAEAKSKEEARGCLGCLKFVGCAAAVLLGLAVLLGTLIVICAKTGR